MASSEAAPAEYDSGEDVIEVAFPPSSSNNNNGSTYPRGPSTSTQQRRQQDSASMPSGSNTQQEARVEDSMHDRNTRLITPPTQRAQHSVPTQEPDPADSARGGLSRAVDELRNRTTDLRNHASDLVEIRERLEGIEREALRVDRQMGDRLHRHHHHHHNHRHHHHHHHHRQARGSRTSPVTLASPPHNRPTGQPAFAYIDLTGEPDSPPGALPHYQVHTQGHQQPANRHPRRTNSQRISPPTLERSDGSSSIPRSMTMSANIIDLTDDSPEQDQRARPAGQLPLPQPPALRTQRVAPRRAPRLPQPRDDIAIARDNLVRVNYVNGAMNGANGFLNDIRGFSRRLVGILGAEMIGQNFLAQNHEQLGMMQARAEPKPSLEPTPPTREGFTRDSCAEPPGEMVAICPCCDEELAYDPNDSGSSSSSATPSKKRKRTPGEHHFWALKSCGHVYCADCFENRRPTKANPEGAGFPVGPGGKPTDIQCAVDGCNTKVVGKVEWIGLYA